MNAGLHYYFETGPYLLSLAGIVGALYCKLLRTELRWNAATMAVVFFCHYGGFGLLSILAVQTRGSAVMIGAALTYVFVGGFVLAGLIPDVALKLGLERFQRRSEFYERYWLFAAGIGVLLETVHRLGWA